MSVGWVRLDDGFALHPKVVTLSVEARWSYIEGLCYAAKYETDGFIPETVAINGHHRGSLVEAGLWDETEGGVMIHDFLEWNPSKAQTDSTRDSKRLAGAIGAAIRYADADEDADLEDLKIREAFRVFWKIYPRHTATAAAEKAFARALKRAPVTTIIAGAERYRDDPNRVDEYTPHGSTWLNQDRWMDDALPGRSRKSDSTAKALEKARAKKRAGA